MPIAVNVKEPKEFINWMKASLDEE
jgi:hypothetical protein